MALRTETEVQPKLGAMSEELCPEALASRIWQRRKVNASAERKPACNCCRAAGVK
jgi:hypothetical protein